jgi:hypothetical protein
MIHSDKIKHILFQITYKFYSDTCLFSVAGEYTADLS